MKVYNVIFPIWLIIFLPPVIIVTLIGNFLIDSLVVVACFHAFRLASPSMDLKTFYKKSIVKVWLFGFLADFIGAALLLLTGLAGEAVLQLSDDLLGGIFYDPYSHPAALVILFACTLLSGFFIFLFNYRLTFRKLIEDQKTRFKVALVLAITTMPWTFLLPTKWFY